MPSSKLDSKQFNYVLVPNQAIPDEGPKAIPLLLDFSVNDTYELDAELDQSLAKFGMLQTLYIDLNNAANALTVIVTGGGSQQIVAKVNTQGYYNILCPNPIRLKFVSVAGGNIVVPVYLINVAIPGMVWPTQ